jgi:hypothetical protein
MTMSTEKPKLERKVSIPNGLYIPGVGAAVLPSRAGEDVGPPPVP